MISPAEKEAKSEILNSFGIMENSELSVIVRKGEIYITTSDNKFIIEVEVDTLKKQTISSASSNP